MPNPPARPGNRLLAKLPDGEYRRLLPHLEPVELALKQVLYRAPYSSNWETRPLDWAMDRIAQRIKETRDEELAQAEREFDGLPTPHPYWLLKAADLAQHATLELPYLEYAEAKKAETDFTRALSAFEKRLAPLIPEPAKEPDPLEPEPTTPEIEEQDLSAKLGEREWASAGVDPVEPLLEFRGADRGLCH